MAAGESSFKTAAIDEKSIRKEKPEELVTDLAEAKAAAITPRLQNASSMLEKDAHTTLLITADTVYFHQIPEEVIDNLIDEGIPFKVAEGLMLEHPLTLPFVEAVIGATDTVMGLSKSLTEKLIQEALCRQVSFPNLS